jgi:hypothetical protein
LQTNGTAITRPIRTGRAPCIVARVVELTAGEFYLFRTQRYGQNSVSRIYHSRDPLNFGVNNDAHLVGTLPVAAPELIRHEGQWYMAALLPSLKGIQIARMTWKPKGD